MARPDPPIPGEYLVSLPDSGSWIDRREDPLVRALLDQMEGGLDQTEGLDAKKPFVSLWTEMVLVRSRARDLLEVSKHAEHHPREFMIQAVGRQTDLALPDCRAPLGTGHSRARLIRASFPAGAGQKPPSVPRDLANCRQLP